MMCLGRILVHSTSTASAFRPLMLSQQLHAWRSAAPWRQKAAAAVPYACGSAVRPQLHLMPPAGSYSFAAASSLPPRRVRMAARNSAMHGGPPRHGGIDEALKRLAVEQLGSQPARYASGETPCTTCRRHMRLVKSPHGWGLERVVRCACLWQLAFAGRHNMPGSCLAAETCLCFQCMWSGGRALRLAAVQLTSLAVDLFGRFLCGRAMCAHLAHVDIWGCNSNNGLVTAVLWHRLLHTLHFLASALHCPMLLVSPVLHTHSPGEGVLDSIVKIYCVYSRSDWLLPWQAHPKREGTGEGLSSV